MDAQIRKDVIIIEGQIHTIVMVVPLVVVPLVVVLHVVPLVDL
ncbi:hypothetical protein CWATWH8502_3783 [Crocosphaera watsonii WH 8502]|uniref:Uncharacterized protein n=1 Tax=Crocosphaera watsonii WH 8502 TaxID=423474 RepID=T2IHE2_CROWT|nr:hypothetical protein CWATWH8502_3783 [Crocosphaera watsonii WH 8502]